MKDYPLNIIEKITNCTYKDFVITDKLKENADNLMYALSQTTSEENYQILVDRFKNKMSQKAVKEKYNISICKIQDAEFELWAFFTRNIGTLFANDEANLKGILQQMKEMYKSRIEFKEKEFNKEIKAIKKKIDKCDEMSASPLSDIEKFLNAKRIKNRKHSFIIEKDVVDGLRRHIRTE